MKPALFAAACVLSVPFMAALGALATTAYLERYWLPKVVGED